MISIVFDWMRIVVTVPIGNFSPRSIIITSSLSGVLKGIFSFNGYN